MLGMPKDFWITKIGSGRGDNWIACVECPCTSFINACGQPLALIIVAENRYQSPAGNKATGIINICNGAARKNCSMLIGCKRDWQLLPMYQIGADGVSPVHRPPNCAVRVILEKQMIF